MIAIYALCRPRAMFSTGPEAKEAVDSEGTVARNRGKIRAQFGDLTISSDFDSGNVDRVEECKSGDTDIKAFNLWTAPDCAGTEYENCNRTWFYFTVTTPSNYGYKILRFTIQNLNKQSRLYQQGLTPMIKTYPGKGTWERLRDRVEHEPAEGGGLKLSFQLVLNEKRNQTIHVAFCFPFTYSECQKMLHKLEMKYGSERTNQGSEVMDTGVGDGPSPLASSIYFHRELLCYSIENRRIDLVTVSSWEGVSEEREPLVQGLFPDKDSVRARSFRNKKIFYLTSRVHPGESPSSHVFNGFLQFILRTDDPRAQLLRRHFVFKLIPMLNPDGVFHGHYRTDTRGMNLNRVYLDPSPELHPSIFAARSLLLHHHHKGQHSSFTDAKPVVSSKQQSSCSCVPESKPCHGGRGREEGESESKLLSLSEQQGCSCVCSYNDGAMSGWCNNETTDEAKNNTHGNLSPSVLKHHQHLHSSSLNTITLNTSRSLHQHASPGNKLTSSSPAIMTRPEQPPPAAQQHVTMSTTTLSDSCVKDNMAPHRDRYNFVSHSDLPEALLATKQSGIAFYVDLHAHATKRGVFMYGNYFSNAVEQAENMLFPKLISLNSPHLDFEHCVFSEKNMYTADKRDGLSKEGSGRVAMHKSMGHIHCYTLECNYNSGRQGNALTPATLDNGRASPPLPYSPMGHRFSIQDFEQVGRALAVAALDMYQLNPWSRLPTTDYGSVAGVRTSLLQRINTSRSKKTTCSKATQLSEVGDQQASSETILASSVQLTGQGSSERRPVISNHKGSTRHSIASLPSSAASVRACKVLLLQKQKALAAVNGSGQIAADVARVAESKRRPRSRRVQFKTGLSPYAPMKRANLKRSDSSSVHVARQGQANTVKPSLQQVVFPLCHPLRLQTDQREPLKEATPFVSSKAAVELVTTSSAPCCITAPRQRQPEASHLPLKRKKLLNRKSRNVMFRQCKSRTIDTTQKESYVQEVNDDKSHLAVSDSEIICKLSRPARIQMRQRAFTSTQIRY